SFARRDGDPAVFVAPKALEAAAGRWLLDRTVLMVEPSKVTRVTVAKEAKVASFQQVGGVWKMEDPSVADAAERAADVRDAVLDLLTEGAATLGPAQKDQGFDRPTLKITIDRTGAPPLHILLGRGDSVHDTDVFYVRREGVDATYMIARSKVMPFVKAL